MPTNMIPKSKILFPCYVYPNPGAWDPLYEAITDFPDVTFTVVVNPGNGPGPDSLPDKFYQHEIPVLASYHNVHIVGYVHMSYASRDIGIVKGEIETYSRWAEISGKPGLAVEGIFLDEVPRQHEEELARYLREVRECVNNSQGLGFCSKVILNPGCIPDHMYVASAFADSTVVFEDTYETWKLRHADRLFSALQKEQARSELSCVIHSIPSTLREQDYKILVNQVRQLAGEIFMTDQSQNYYASFAPGWRRFVEAMAE